MGEKNKNSKTIWAVLLLVLIYMSRAGAYIKIDADNFLWLGLINFCVASFIMMVVPLSGMLNTGKKMDLEKGKHLCKVNSIVLFILSFVTLLLTERYFVGGVGAIVYYYINKWLFVEDESKKDIIEAKSIDIEDESKKEIIKTKSFDIDYKYSGLIKLNELLEKKIITKDEFDKEKEKLLNDKN